MTPLAAIALFTAIILTLASITLAIAAVQRSRRLRLLNEEWQQGFSAFVGSVALVLDMMPADPQQLDVVGVLDALKHAMARARYDETTLDAVEELVVRLVADMEEDPSFPRLVILERLLLVRDELLDDDEDDEVDAEEVAS